MTDQTNLGYAIASQCIKARFRFSARYRATPSISTPCMADEGDKKRMNTCRVRRCREMRYHSCNNRQKADECLSIEALSSRAMRCNPCDKLSNLGYSHNMTMTWITYQYLGGASRKQCIVLRYCWGGITAGKKTRV